MYVTTAESRNGFPDLSHPRVGLHITNAHEPAVPGEGTHYAVLGAGEIYILHITNAHKAGWTGLGSILRRTRCKGKGVHLVKVIFDTHRSPHIGSKLCYVRAPRGVG